MKISFDFDGTLTSNPQLFRQITSAFSANGDDLFVISGRRTSKPIEQFLEEHDFPQMEIQTQDRLMGNGKTGTIDQLGIDLHFDNNPAVADAVSSEVFLVGQKPRTFGEVK